MTLAALPSSLKRSVAACAPAVLSAGAGPAMAAACCAACAADQPTCTSWLAYVTAHGKPKKGTCILNDAIIMGQAPDGPECVSGGRPLPHWPPAPPPVRRAANESDERDWR